MSEPSDIPRPAPQPSWMARLTQTRVPLWVVVALLLLWLITLGWQRVAVSRTEAKLEQDRAAMTAKFEADRNVLLSQLRTRMEAESDESKRQFGLSLAWAVRGEMIRNNLDQVDQFFAEIVKLPNTERVLLVGNDGKVLVTTDRRYQGADATSLIAADVLQQTEVGVRNGTDGSKQLIIPIMGLNSRLGTVVMRYRQPDGMAGT
jgi:hypothetical protein